ncbi:MAG: hypothetical protein IPK58_06700 [Acidobacteria bacterium]|nr:hypothetical protein [Acidobacteriota bacterium]
MTQFVKQKLLQRAFCISLDWKEVKDKVKSIIRRKTSENRNEKALLENAITILRTKDSLRKVSNISDYGETSEERYFNVAELCITDKPHLIFEVAPNPQLVGYHKGNQDYRFLNAATIPEFDELFTLFHQVLAKTLDDRSEGIKDKFKLVPYLNSSLFEISELEDTTLSIESLKRHGKATFIQTTVLKNSESQRKHFKRWTPFQILGRLRLRKRGLRRDSRE